MPIPVNPPEPWTIALSAGTGDLATAPVGSVITVDMNSGATSPATMLSTKLTIDASEKSSVSGATQGVLSSTTMADNDIITFDIDTVGSSTAGSGLQITLYYVRL